MQRVDLENKSLNEILNIINVKYGLTKANSLVAREMTRIYNKCYSRDVILSVKKEAAIRVLTGQSDNKDPLKNHISDKIN